MEIKVDREILVDVFEFIKENLEVVNDREKVEEFMLYLEEILED